MEIQPDSTPAIAEDGSVAPLHRYHGPAITISAWQFPREGWKFQFTPMGDTAKHSQGYIIVTMEGAMQLHHDLSRALRDRGIIV